MKIAAVAIAKNEERNLKDFLGTIKDFDEVVVVDTGSTDTTARLLREAGIKVIGKVFEPFDFSEARNYSLSQVSKDIDFCFSIDLNERLDDKWREKCENILLQYPDTTVIEIMRYDDCDGEVKRGSEDKLILHRREMYEWKNAVHEVLSLRPKFVEHKVKSDIAITKKIQRTRAKEDFYATICMREYRRAPEQDFYLWFLTGYYYERQEWQQFIEYGLRYLSVTASVKSDFRVQIYIRLSRLWYDFGDKEQSFRYGMLGFSEAMFVPDTISFGQATEHMIHYALVTDNAALLVYMMSFVPQSSQELIEVRTRALQKLSS
jgi:glycosyltransferase involved in cell wall biosynthesis